jgi:hypothetical protein
VSMATLWNHTFELPFMGRKGVMSQPVGVVPTQTLQPVPPA